MLDIYTQLHNYIIKIELVYFDIKIKPYDTQKHVYVHDYICGMYLTSCMKHPIHLLGWGFTISKPERKQLYVGSYLR